MLKIALIHDVHHLLIERMRERIEAKGAACDFVHWSALPWSEEATAAFAQSYDAVYLDRMGETTLAYSTQLALLTALEERGVRVVNRPGPYWVARNKALTAKECARLLIPTPRTAVAFQLKDVLRFVEADPGESFVCKSVLGSCAEDVYPFRATEPPFEAIQKILKRDGAIIVQAFVNNPDRYIWRIDVVDGRIVVANQRFSFNSGELPVCNGTQGGRIEFHDPARVPADVAELALNATRALGLEVAGVDILKSESGQLYLAEVNPEPDITLERLEFPRAIADHVLSVAQGNQPGQLSKELL
jgi:RimK family alpha-L-glutamate ligase